MTDKIIIEGLTAESVGAISLTDTVELINDRISELNLKTIQEVLLTLYVDNTIGNNSIADGTQEKPFNTCLAAISYAKRNFDLVYEGTISAIPKVVLQIVDSVTPYPGLYFSDLHIGLEIIGNIDNPSNVIFNGLLEFYSGELVVRGITFTTTISSINSIRIGRARLSLYDCVFSGTHTNKSVIYLIRLSILQLSRVSITNTCSRFVLADSHCSIEINNGCSANGSFSSFWIDISKPNSFLQLLAKPSGTSTGNGIFIHPLNRIQNKNNLPVGLTNIVFSELPIKFDNNNDYLNSWAGNLYYTDEGNGFLSLHGTLTGSNSNLAAITIPFKPYANLSVSFLVPITSGTGTTAIVTISNLGVLTPTGFTGTVTLNLSGIRFRIA